MSSETQTTADLIAYLRKSLRVSVDVVYFVPGTSEPAIRVALYLDGKQIAVDEASL